MNTPQTPLTLVIMAAGMGSRYGGLKQIDAVGPGGECIMDYSIHDALQAGFNRVLFVIRPDMQELFHESVGHRLAPHMPVAYAFQRLDQLPPPHTPPRGRTKPWGTAHAILAAREQVQGNFAVINADDFYGRASFRILADRLRDPAAGPGDYCMVAFPLRNTLSPFGSVSRGICRLDENHHLIDIREHTCIEPDEQGQLIDTHAPGHPPFTGEEPASMNLWGFQPDFFQHIEQAFRTFLATRGNDPKAELYIPDVIASLLARRTARVRVLASPDPWFGITYPDDKPRMTQTINQYIARGLYPRELWPPPAHNPE